MNSEQSIKSMLEKIFHQLLL